MSQWYGHRHQHSHGYNTDHRHQHQHNKGNFHRAINREGGGELSPNHQHSHQGDTASPVSRGRGSIASLQAEVRAKVRDNNTFASLFRNLAETNGGTVEAADMASRMIMPLEDVLLIAARFPKLKVTGSGLKTTFSRKDEPSSE